MEQLVRNLTAPVVSCVRDRSQIFVFPRLGLFPALYVEQIESPPYVFLGTRLCSRISGLILQSAQGAKICC